VSKSTRNYLLIAGIVSEDGKFDNADLMDYTVSKIESVIGRVRESARSRSSHRLLDAGLARPGQADEVRNDLGRRRAGAPGVQRRGLGGAARRRPRDAGAAPQRLDPRAVAPEDAEEFAGVPLRTNATARS